jgi:glutamate synthase domain-containing protein 3
LTSDSNPVQTPNLSSLSKVKFWKLAFGGKVYRVRLPILTLDKLQSRGQGMIEARVYVRPMQDTQPATNQDDYFKAQCGSAASRSKAVTARLNSQTAVRNTNSASRLTAILEDAKQKCGGSLNEKPRLFILPSGAFTGVYMIDGIVTKMK